MGKRYVVKSGHNNCHPETCSCRDWGVYDTGGECWHTKDDDYQTIKDLCDLLNTVEETAKEIEEFIINSETDVSARSGDDKCLLNTTQVEELTDDKDEYFNNFLRSLFKTLNDSEISYKKRVRLAKEKIAGLII